MERTRSQRVRPVRTAGGDAVTDIDRSPTRLASVVAVVTATAVVGLTGLYSWLTLGFGLVGLLVLIIGVVAGRQSAVTFGSASIFLGVLLAGIDGAPELVLLLGAVGAVVAWDSAGTAIGLGRQLGRDASTARLEVVHTATAAVIGVTALGGAYGIYTFATGEGSMTAVVLFLFGIVLVASALR